MSDKGATVNFGKMVPVRGSVAGARFDRSRQVGREGGE